jgi:hypothetical protein
MDPIFLITWFGASSNAQKRHRFLALQTLGKCGSDARFSCAVPDKDAASGVKALLPNISLTPGCLKGFFVNLIFARASHL